MKIRREHYYLISAALLLWDWRYNGWDGMELLVWFMTGFHLYKLFRICPDLAQNKILVIDTFKLHTVRGFQLGDNAI
jgi:hypothetical protein